MTDIGFREGQSEWAKTDAIRWGDASAVIMVAAPALAVVGQSAQLVRANVPRPLVWALQLNADGVAVAAGEVNPITVDFAVTIGSGQSRTTIHQTIVLTAANGYHWPLGVPPPQLLLPALDIQVNAFVRYLASVAGQTSIEVAAMCAPFTRWD